MSTRQFGATWWGQAWIAALEERAAVDPTRLPRGRTYARQDRVGRLELAPGKVTALVRGQRALPYRVTVTVPTARAGALDDLAAAIARRAASAAALLDHELDPVLVEDATALDVALLPGTGELKTRCSCPDWADPCKHAAAVCYLVADELDRDPFQLLLLRGIEREPLLDLVRAHRSGAPVAPDAASDGQERIAPGGRRVAAELGGGSVLDPGTVARDAWARTPEPIPRNRLVPAAPGAVAPWASDPPKDAPFTAAGLAELAADAAARAWAQLAEGATSALDLDAEADLARRAATRLDHLDELLALAKRSGVGNGQLVHHALAWRSAGADGLTAIDEARWRPPTDLLDRGLAALAEAGYDEHEVQVRSNRLTVGDVQLRVTSDERWWRYEQRGRSWELVEAPSHDPFDLVDT